MSLIPKENVANIGYLAIKPQADGNTPITPDIILPLYKETLATDLKLDLDNPISGTRAKVFNAFMGQRQHDGVLTVLAEPNSAQHFFKMMLKAGVITGGGPYSHPLTVDDPQTYYTIDMLKGQIVFRFFGVQAESINPAFDKNKMTFDIDVTAKGAFAVRTIASVSSAPNHVVLDTNYDPSPTFGLVVGDKIRLFHADASAQLDTTVVTIVDGVTIEVADDPTGYLAGDCLFLRSATSDPDVEATVLDPFMWARTEFHFADTVTNALAQTSAQQTHIEQGSKWKLMYAFEKKQGADRSGSFDPVSLPRLQAEAQLTIKEFLDQPQDLARWANVQDRACVIRMFSGADKELRIILNSIKQKSHKPPLETGKLVYSEIEYEARYNSTDEQLFSVLVINSNAS